METARVTIAEKDANWKWETDGERKYKYEIGTLHLRMSPLCWFRRFATLVLRSQTVGLGFEGIAIGTSGNFELD